MEGPELSGPQVWIDLTKKTEPKILQFISSNKERLNWLDEYLEECKTKLGVAYKDGPSFVPKVNKIHLIQCSPFINFNFHV